MYRVVLVDDEAWSLESIVNLVKWDTCGYEIAGAFTDSEEAYDYIKKTRPDVIFTDIRMPALSGLQLMRKAAEDGVKDGSFFVIVSGYGEFEYAKEALKLGAYDYCLKPVDKLGLEQLLKRLREELDDICIQRDYKAFQALLSPGCEPLSWLEARGFGDEEYWQACMLLDLSGRADPIPEPPGCALLRLSKRRLLLLGSSCKEKDEPAARLVEEAGLEKKYLVGMSRQARGAGALPQLIREAEMASCQYFIDPGLQCGLIRYAGKSLSTTSVAAKSIDAQIAAGSYEKALENVGAIPSLLRENKLCMLHAIHIFNELIAVLAHRFDNEIISSGHMNCSQIVSSFPDCEAMCEYLKSIIIGNCDPGGEDNMYLNISFRKLLRHVDEHYAEQLGLKELARQYFIGFSYCCYLFKKSTGKTFNEYILDKRMADAYKLLQTGGCSIPDVSARVGYSDQYYFCKRFKHYFGVAPSRVIGRSLQEGRRIRHPDR